ncbi:MAG: rhodanese-like domain-containing protein [Halobacteriales archaeon]
MVEEITTQELVDKLEDDDVQVLDIREQTEVNQTDGGFVPGSIHLPMSRLPLEIEDHDWSDEIYVICRHGNSSLQAARLLLAYEGVDEDARVASVAGGYLDYDGELEYRGRAADPRAAA